MKRIRFRNKKHSAQIISKVYRHKSPQDNGTTLLTKYFIEDIYAFVDNLDTIPITKHSIEDIHTFVENLETTATISIPPPSISHRPAKPKQHSTSRKTVRYVSAAAALIFIGLLIFAVIVPVLQGSTHILTVLSGSMAPGINPGDIVVSTRINPQIIHLNDVITFSYADNPKNSVTHRVINITTTKTGMFQFQTKGDANKDPDRRWVQQPEVVGKVSTVIPYLGYVSYFAKSKLGFFIIIVIPAVIIILQEVWTIYKEQKKKIHIKNQ